MSSVLNPSYATIGIIRTLIQNTLKMDLPPDLMANAIAPYLTSVTQWSSQISTMLEGSDSPSAANLVFAIRKDVFNAPPYSHSVMGTPLVDLPAPFQEFMNFIHRVIEMQKSEKEKPIGKVRTFFFRDFVYLNHSFDF